MEAKIAVLGAGRFGFALANRFAQGGYQTDLWGRSSLILASPMGVGCKFTSGPTPANLTISSGGELPDLSSYHAIFVTTDSTGVEALVPRIAKQNLGEIPVLFVQKGLVQGVSPVLYASRQELCAGSFTGAAFARDIFAGSAARMIAASDESWICDKVYDLCKPLGFLVAKCAYPEDICAANVSRTIASIEMGVVAGYADYLVQREAEELRGLSGAFSATEIAAVTSGIQNEWQTLSELISPGFTGRILMDQSQSNVRTALWADNYLCSGLIRDPRCEQVAERDGRTGLQSAKSVSRNWRFGYELGRRQDADLAEQALKADGVVQGAQSAITLFCGYPTCPPFLDGLGMILTGHSSVKAEVARIRDRNA